MQISGINKFSLIEYPGEISCVVFSLGCNMRCPFCHNGEFVLPEKMKTISYNLIPERAFFNFIKERQGVLTGVSICGGEPTLQKDLKNFCKKIKEFGYKIKLDTNGRSPKILRELIDEGLIDYVAMDIKHEAGKMSEISGVNINEKDYIESIDLLLNSQIDYEFRTTVIKGIHNEETIERIAKYISGAKNYFLQKYRKEKTLDPDFKGEEFTEKELKKLEKVGKKYIKHIGLRY